MRGQPAKSEIRTDEEDDRKIEDRKMGLFFHFPVFNFPVCMFLRFRSSDFFRISGFELCQPGCNLAGAWCLELLIRPLGLYHRLVMADSEPFWHHLFCGSSSDTGSITRQMWLLKKEGRPFLLLPLKACAATAALSLYPAQRGRARIARTVLRWWLTAGAPFGVDEASVTLSPKGPFLRFLSELTDGAARQAVPELGILAGNPASPGQRFLVLVFDPNGRPAALAKVGLSAEARALIEKEASFLKSAPAHIKQIPQVRANFETQGLRAFAMDFFAGDSPRLSDETALPSLLGGWINPDKKIALDGTPSWRALKSAAASEPLFGVIAGRLDGGVIHPVLHHGDFAPWNIKISPSGQWTVLDWERGELVGIPGWDWFHYVIQTAILVQRQEPSHLVERVQALLDSESFGKYAAAAGISGCHRELLLAYLLHMIHVVQPSEGLVQCKDLLRVSALRFLGH
jgi:hypothetical protein